MVNKVLALAACAAITVALPTGPSRYAPDKRGVNHVVENEKRQDDPARIWQYPPPPIGEYYDEVTARDDSIARRDEHIDTDPYPSPPPSPPTMKYGRLTRTYDSLLPRQSSHSILLYAEGDHDHADDSVTRRDDEHVDTGGPYPSPPPSPPTME